MNYVGYVGYGGECRGRMLWRVRLPCLRLWRLFGRVGVGVFSTIRGLLLLSTRFVREDACFVKAKLCTFIKVIFASTSFFITNSTYTYTKTMQFQACIQQPHPISYFPPQQPSSESSESTTYSPS